MPKRANPGNYEFATHSQADPHGTLFRDFFQTDRDGHPKGIVVIELRDFT